MSTSFQFLFLLFSANPAAQTLNVRHERLRDQFKYLHQMNTAFEGMAAAVEELRARRNTLQADIAAIRQAADVYRRDADHYRNQLNWTKMRSKE